jgi:hypothetical protein
MMKRRSISNSFHQMLLILAITLIGAGAIQSPSIRGNRFLNQDGSVFVLKGLAYQPTVRGQFQGITFYHFYIVMS